MSFPHQLHFRPRDFVGFVVRACKYSFIMNSDLLYVKLCLVIDFYYFNVSNYEIGLRLRCMPWPNVL